MGHRVLEVDVDRKEELMTDLTSTIERLCFVQEQVRNAVSIRIIF